MIQIDRNARAPIHEQIVDQLRFLIARGRFSPGQTLPSTRTLADQIGVSFHSVRKAYQDLVNEGVLVAIRGRGYMLAERSSSTTSQQMERGAAIVQEALHRLVGLGLGESDIEYLVEEQLSELLSSDGGPRVVFLGRYAEEAKTGAAFVAQSLQLDVEPAVFADLSRFEDADFVIAPYSEIRLAMQRLPRTDVIGVAMGLPGEVLEQTARLYSQDTVALLTLSAATIQPLSNELRRQTGFPGQILAAAVSESAEAAGRVVEQADVVLYTPGAKRRAIRFIPKNTTALLIHAFPTAQSMRSIGDAISANLRS
ncbi:MAG: GntR family transcriptional regulator [Rhodothermales bacterium]|nr:GntR family transcriptional regulator [Rhodothermales bacterium]